MERINLKSELILHKKFSTELSGYNAKEVDEYFDLMLADYRIFENEMELNEEKTCNLEKLIADKIEENEKLKIEIEEYKAQLEAASGTSNSEIKRDLEDIKRKLSKI